MMHKFADEVDSLLSSLLEDKPQAKLTTQISEKYQLPIRVGITNQPIDKGDKPWIVGNFAPGKYLNETHPQGHEGVDLKAPINTPIYPIASGIVIDTSENPKGGKTCKIAHENGNVISYYAHLSKVNVNVQQQVNQKTAIGIIGQTGNAKGRGEHLHFEVKVNGNKIDPMTIVGKDVGSLSKKKKAEWDQFIGQFVKKAGLVKLPEWPLNEIIEFVLSNFCNLVLNKVNDRLKEISKEIVHPNDKDYFNQANIHLNLLKNECKKYIKNKFQKEKKFKYGLHNILVITKVNLHYPGLYTPKSNTDHIIEIKLEPQRVYSVQDLHDELKILVRNTKHEFTHFMQVVQAEVAQTNITGIPFKHTHENKYDIHGYDRNPNIQNLSRYMQEQLRQEHMLRDIEFYPRVLDSISKFKEIWDNYPDAVKEAAAKVWIGLPNNFTGEIARLFHPDEFFKKLRMEQFHKWKKAVKEFWKKVFYDDIVIEANIEKTAGLIKVPKSIYEELYEFAKNYYLSCLDIICKKHNDENLKEILQNMEFKKLNIFKQTTHRINYENEIIILTMITGTNDHLLASHLSDVVAGKRIHDIQMHIGAEDMDKIETNEDIKNDLNYIKDSIRHELQHMMQDIYSKDKSESGELPSKKIRNKYYNTRGILNEDQIETGLPLLIEHHDLLDPEFLHRFIR